MWPIFLILMSWSASSWGFNFTTDFNNGFYWSELPLKITVMESDSTRKSSLEKIVKNSISDWQAQTGLSIWSFLSSTTSAATQNVIRWSTNFAAETNMDASSVLAITIRYSNGPYFAKTEIVINGNHSINQNASNLYTTITHELGHTIGLDHSNANNAVMAPYIQIPYMGLQADDVQGMSQLVSETDGRQVSGYISPLSYQENPQVSSVKAFGCATVSFDPSGAKSAQSFLSLGLGLLLSLIRRFFTYIRWKFFK